MSRSPRPVLRQKSLQSRQSWCRVRIAWHRGNSDAELWALAAIENIASQRVLEKVGFGYVSGAEHNDTPCALYRLGT